MNYEQASSVKRLASDVMKVLERLEIEKCEWCNGTGKMLPKDRKRLSGLLDKSEVHCRRCNGKGKIKWEYFVQPGDWFLYKNDVYLRPQTPGWLNKRKYSEHVPQKNCIPILGWEEIEGVLEKAGYIVDVWNTRTGNYYCEIDDGNDENKMYKGAGSFFQEAVMKAVLALRKEIKK